MPCTLSILTNVFTGEGERARAIGIWSGTAGLGVAIGPILGGFLLGPLLVGVGLPHQRPDRPGRSRGLRIPRPQLEEPHDPGGRIRSAPCCRSSGIGLLLWGIIEAPNRTWTSPLILAALVGAAAIIGLFVVWERRSDHPMLPMQFFGNRRYSAAIAALALVLFALLGLFFLVTQYLQFSLGFSPLETGLGHRAGRPGPAGGGAVIGDAVPAIRHQGGGGRWPGLDRRGARAPVRGPPCTAPT